MVFVGNLRSFPLYGNQNRFCACWLLLSSFYFRSTKTAFLAFFGQLTDVSSISLKRTFLLFRCYITLFSAFLHCMEVLVFLQVITMIVTLSHSKKYFCFFFLAGSHSNETFSRFKSKISMSSTFFALETVFGCSKLITLF